MIYLFPLTMVGEDRSGFRPYPVIDLGGLFDIFIKVRC